MQSETEPSKYEPRIPRNKTDTIIGTSVICMTFPKLISEATQLTAFFQKFAQISFTTHNSAWLLKFLLILSKVCTNKPHSKAIQQKAHDVNCSCLSFQKYIKNNWNSKETVYCHSNGRSAQQLVLTESWYCEKTLHHTQFCKAEPGTAKAKKQRKHLGGSRGIHPWRILKVETKICAI